MAAETAPGVGPLIKLFQMQARDMRVAAHAQDLSESDLEPLKNKHQTLRVMEAGRRRGRPEAGRNLGCPRDICVAVNICFILKEGKREETDTSFIYTQMPLVPWPFLFIIVKVSHYFKSI